VKRGSAVQVIAHPATVAVRGHTGPVDAIAFHYDLLGADDPASFFNVST
jgi:hypothetical protein